MADCVQTNGTQAKEPIGVIDSTDGADAEMRLEFSGLSEELSGQSSALDLQNASSTLADLDAHVTPIAAAQAIKSNDHDDNEHCFSDDDVPKVLTTLEPMKKAVVNDDDITVCHVEVVDDEHEEGTILLEVYNEDDQPTAEKEVADSQQDSLDPCKPLEKVTKIVRTNKRSRKNLLAKTIPSPNANISIEMPSELLMSCVKSPPRKLDNDELIAILEGDDQSDGAASGGTATYEVTIVNDSTRTDAKSGMTKAEEREIAMQQIMNLPRKKKGRPPTANKAATNKSKGAGTSNLVKSLVSDWNDDGEAKVDDQHETEILVEINDNGVAEINAVPVIKTKKGDVSPEGEMAQPTFRRSRIIKKKIIWDPDAPETAINYASFAHTSGPGTVKKRAAPKKSAVTAPDESNVPVQEISAQSSTAKKKKTSEIDKLLGDEGAVNMLNSLNNQENGNSISVHTNKSSRIKAIKTEIVEEPVVAAAPSPKPKASRKESTKEASPHKSGAAKKGVSPTGTGKKRGPKPAAASWDYVYSSRPDDCMIVRRRSNSSYSSTASLNRSSIELPCAPPIIDDDEPPVKKSKASKEKLFEFTKPTPKLPIRQGEHVPTINDTSRRKRLAADAKQLTAAVILTKIKKEKKNGAIDAPIAPVVGFDVEQECSTTDHSEICVKKYKNFAQIILKPYPPAENDDHVNDNKTLLTTQMMKEVETSLQTLDGDKTCKLVLITSANSTFCSGIDSSTLLHATAEKRRLSALELSKKLM